MEWISVNERLPKSGRPVLIHYNNGYRDIFTMGYYAAKYELEADYEFYYEEDYCEEKDQYFQTEGWKDSSAESQYHYPIRNVTHWAEITPPETN